MVDVGTVLGAWDVGAVRAVEPVSSGLIHGTWFVDADPPLVLQRLHPKLDSDEIAADYAAVTAHLAAKGVAAPRLVPTREGALLAEADGARWRLTTRLPGRTFEKPTGPAMIEQAARALGRFHRALADLEHEFRSTHPLHHTVEHLDALRGAAADPAHAPVLPGCRAEVDAAIEQLAGALLPADLPVRVVHGDPKLSNVLFDGADAVGLIDLDTCNRHTLLVDLGDAARSWCRDGGEDEQQGLRLDSFEALVRGYAAEGPTLDAAEVAALPDAPRTITLELAARFARDVLCDDYFGWDRSRYPDRRSHNLARARGMLHLAEDMRRHRDALTRLVGAAFGC